MPTGSVAQDTGVHTNPAQWLQDHHWESGEVALIAAGAPGQLNLGTPVAAGKTRRIRAVTVRHAGTANTVITIVIAGGATKKTIDLPATTTRVWSSEDGIAFTAGQQPAVQTSDVTGAGCFVSAEGVEA